MVTLDNREDNLQDVGMSMEEIIQKKNILQQEAVNTWYDAGMVGTLDLYTGAGKNFCFFKALYKVWPKGDKLAEIWFCSETNARKYDLEKEADKFESIYGNNPLKDFHINFGLYQSLYKDKNKSFDFVCLDEIQDCITPSRVEFLTRNKFKRKLGLTATPGLNKPVSKTLNKEHFYNKYCPIIFSYHVHDAIDEGIYSKIKIDLVYTSLDKETKHQLFKKGNPCTELAYYRYFDRKYTTGIGKSRMFAAMKRSSCLSEMPSRIKVAKKLVDLYESVGEKTVIIGNSLDSLSQITPHVIKSRPKNEDYLNKELRYKFDNDLINTLGSFKILQQGANLNSMNNLILFSHFSDEDKFLQRLGRARLGNHTTRVTVLCCIDTVEEEKVENFLRLFKNVDRYYNFNEYYEKRTIETANAS